MKTLTTCCLFILICYSTNILAETLAQQPDGWSDGSGGEIRNLANLRWLSETKEAWDENWVLMSNIDAEETKTWNVGDDGVAEGFRPIALWGSWAAFEGIFNGNGYSILNLYINKPSSTQCALFAQTKDAIIKDLSLLQIEVTGWNLSGCIIASSINSDVVNCNVTGKLHAGDVVGSIVGDSENDTIVDCSVNVELIGKNSVGGIAGRTKHSSIIHCQSYGDIKGVSTIGGIAGISRKCSIDQCKTKGYIIGESNVGGIIGRAYECELSKSKTSCSVRGDATVAGIIGWAEHCNLEDCTSNAYVIVYFKQGAGLIGGMIGGSIVDCSMNRVVLGSNAYQVGGLVGLTYLGDIEIKYSNMVGTVIGREDVGGLIGGQSSDLFMKECYSAAFVQGKKNVGGLIGDKSSGLIVNCFATGTCKGEKWVGGCFGENRNAKDKFVLNIFNNGLVVGNEFVGGIAGSNNGEIYNCYSTGITQGDIYVGGIAGCVYEKIINAYNSGTVFTTQYLEPDITYPSYAGAIAGTAPYEYKNLISCYYDVETVGPLPKVGRDMSKYNKSATTEDSSAISTDMFTKDNIDFSWGETDGSPWRIDENGRPYFYWYKANVTNGVIDSSSAVVSGYVNENGAIIAETGVRHMLNSAYEWHEQVLGQTKGSFSGELVGLKKDSTYLVQCYAKDSSGTCYYGDMLLYKSKLTTTASKELIYFANNGDSIQNTSRVIFEEKAMCFAATNPFYFENRKFVGWNTSPHGSGKAYNEGDKIDFVGDSNLLSLYAQWSTEENVLVSIKELFVKQEDCKIYPNPIYNKLNIEGKNSIRVIRIIDINGRVQKVFDSVNQNSLSIDLSELETGIYIISVQYDSYVSSQKVIKK